MKKVLEREKNKKEGKGDKEVIQFSMTERMHRAVDKKGPR